MINSVIKTSIKYRFFTVAFAAALLVYGTLVVLKMPVDVFPDLNRPVVTILVEAEGLAPEEVEPLVVFPIETLLNGATNVERVRSVAGVGLAIVYVEFGWGTDIYIARQIVTEKLQLAQARLPKGVTPALAPVSSIMGEIMLIGVSSLGGRDPIDVRTIADWEIRQRLMAVPGVAQVLNIGGGVKQYQILADPFKLREFGVTLESLKSAVSNSNVSTPGGFLESSSQEYLVRNVGRINTLDDIKGSIVSRREGYPVTINQLAKVTVGAMVKRGDASVNGTKAVILSVQKQPGANTVILTKKIEEELKGLRQTLPKDLHLQILFRQSSFIEAAIGNVIEALRDGSILVAIVLFIFLLNFRTTFITLTAIPLSFLVSILIMNWFGITVNTMTLGGLAVAIGELVDDAIIDVENIFRRLRENAQSSMPKPALQVVFEASSEVRNSIIYATLIIALVFIPLFFLGGIEGRFFIPLGIAYIVSLLASLVVSLTVTPALSAILLPKKEFIAHRKDGFFVMWLKVIYSLILLRILKEPIPVLAGTLILCVGSAALFPLMGKEFLPPFNEGTYTVNLFAEPGTSLSESNRIGTLAEKELLTIPEVLAVGRRTGRAEMDEHAEGVHYTEIDVDLKEGRPKELIEEEIRAKLGNFPGVSLNIGQPISHRLDHLLSGVRAQLAVKLFGPELEVLRKKAVEIKDVIAQIPGVVDLSIEKQVLLPQIKIQVNREMATKFGVSAEKITRTMETALNGDTVSQILEGQRTFDLVVRYDEPYRNDINVIKESLIDIAGDENKVEDPEGPAAFGRAANGGIEQIPISLVAKVEEAKGPNQILHENIVRRIVIQCNTSGRDLGSVVKEIQARINKEVNLPQGYFVNYGGQFESQQSATKLLTMLLVLSVAGIFMILYSHFKFSRIALQVMANLPLAVIGGVIAVFLTGGVLSIASLLGFITVFGIVSRNGIMMISHFIHLMEEEGETFGPPMIIRGALERLSPILMTALTAALGLIPLVLAAGEPGKELLHPLAVVILGGLISSTVLNLLVTPVLFYRFGGAVWQKILLEREAVNY